MSIHVRRTGARGIGPLVSLVRCDQCRKAEFVPDPLLQVVWSDSELRGFVTTRLDPPWMCDHRGDFCPKCADDQVLRSITVQELITLLNSLPPDHQVVIPGNGASTLSGKCEVGMFDAGKTDFFSTTTHNAVMLQRGFVQNHKGDV